MVDPGIGPAQVAAALIDQAGSARGYRPSGAAGVPLADVELSVERFVQQDRLVRQVDEPVPALRDGDGLPIPIDIGLPGADQVGLVAEVDPGVVRYLVRVASAPSRYQEGHIRLVSPDEAGESFRLRLTRFLGLRLGRSATPAPVPTGYQFTVSTDTPGLRVHYSPAYFINRNLAFGSPTTPIAGPLLPGRYTFGAYPPAGGYWDGAEYDVPGPQHAAHLSV